MMEAMGRERLQRRPRDAARSAAPPLDMGNLLNYLINTGFFWRLPSLDATISDPSPASTIAHSTGILAGAGSQPLC